MAVKTRPTDNVELWGEAATWTSGPKAGNATKATPSQATAEQGHVAGQSFKSEYDNDWKNKASHWIQYLKDGGGAGQAFFEDGQDGNIQTAGTVSLTRDTYYDDVLIQNGGVINTQGYVLHCNKLTINAGGRVANNGLDGATGSSPVGGAGAPVGTLGGGGAGGDAGNTDDEPGDDGVTSDPTYNTGYGGVGGVGGNGTGALGDGGASGASPDPASPAPESVLKAHSGWFLESVANGHLPYTGGGGGAGGGAGDAADSSSFAGGSGGGGAGVMILMAKELVLNGTIQANGGDGGDGLSAPSGGAGGGGAGGGGGYLVLIYIDKSGSGTVEALGGTGGLAGGVSPQTSRTSSPGADGSNGTVTEIQV